MWRGASLAMDSTDDMSAKIIHSPTRHQPLVVSWKPVTRASNPSLRVGAFCYLNARRASHTVFRRDLTDTVRSTTAFDGCPTEVSRAQWAAVQASIVVPQNHPQHSTEGNVAQHQSPLGRKLSVRHTPPHVCVGASCDELWRARCSAVCHDARLAVWRSCALMRTLKTRCVAWGGRLGASIVPTPAFARNYSAGADPWSVLVYWWWLHVMRFGSRQRTALCVRW
jgi:hypothetical protein